MEKLEMEKRISENVSQVACNKIGNKKDTGNLLEYLTVCADGIMKYADLYEFGEDVVIEFEECQGKDLLVFLSMIEDYGIDLENVRVYSNEDGWITVGVFIG